MLLGPLQLVVADISLPVVIEAWVRNPINSDQLSVRLPSWPMPRTRPVPTLSSERPTDAYSQFTVRDPRNLALPAIRIPRSAGMDRRQHV